MKRLAYTAAALLIATAPLPAQTPAAAKPPAYEYKVFAASPTTPAEQIEAALNQLGSEGWEVVGTRTVRQFYSLGDPTSRREGDGLQVFLKRLKRSP